MTDKNIKNFYIEFLNNNIKIYQLFKYLKDVNSMDKYKKILRLINQMIKDSDKHILVLDKIDKKNIKRSFNYLDFYNKNFRFFSFLDDTEKSKKKLDKESADEILDYCMELLKFSIRMFRMLKFSVSKAQRPIIEAINVDNRKNLGDFFILQAEFIKLKK